MLPNRTVCLLGVIVAVQASACVVDGGASHHGSGSSGGSRPVGTSEGGLSVQWDLAYLDGAATDCVAAGTPTVAVVSRLRSTGESFTAAFPCDDEVGVMDRIPPGVYDVSLDLQDDLGRTVSIADYAGVVVFSNDVSAPDRKVRFSIQAWDLAWTIAIDHRRGSSTPVRCGEVGATTVRFITQLGVEEPETYDLDCGSYSAVTTAIRPGDYQVQMLLLDGAGRAISDTDAATYPVSAFDPALVDVDFGVY
jgi:hypothetical protein